MVCADGHFGRSKARFLAPLARWRRRRAEEEERREKDAEEAARRAEEEERRKKDAEEAARKAEEERRKKDAEESCQCPSWQTLLTTLEGKARVSKRETFSWQTLQKPGKESPKLLN